MTEIEAIRLLGVFGVGVIAYFAGRSHELYVQVKKRASNVYYTNEVKNG